MICSYFPFFHFLLACFLLAVCPPAASQFRAEQMRYARVRKAFEEKETKVNQLLIAKNINAGQFHVFFRAFKREKILEVWCKNANERQYVKVQEYPVCALSGDLGPKRREGDGQIPEGVYHIDRFNPSSSFHLSLGVSYPNRLDRAVCQDGKPGGDIFIHGACVTIGCLPMTDELIREIYVFAVKAKESGQAQLPVHIFPFRLSREKIDEVLSEGLFSKKYQQHQVFWESLLPIYMFFEKHQRPPRISAETSGIYKLLE